MALGVKTFCIGVLSRNCRVADKPGIGTPQSRLALLRALPRCLGTPAQQNFTQIPNGDIHSGRQIDLAVSAIVHAIVAERQYFGAHASLPNQPAGTMAASG